MFAHYLWVRNLGVFFYSNNLRSNRTKKRTITATTTAKDNFLLFHAFISHLWWHLSDIIFLSCLLLCNHVSYREFLCVPYAFELDYVGHYSSITCNPVCLLRRQIGICCRFANILRSQCNSLESTLVRR